MLGEKVGAGDCEKKGSVRRDKRSTVFGARGEGERGRKNGGAMALVSTGKWPGVLPLAVSVLNQAISIGTELA